jgi:hypothetical protein
VVVSTYKTDRQDIVEIFLKMALNTTTLPEHMNSSHCLVDVVVLVSSTNKSDCRNMTELSVKSGVKHPSP